VKRDQLRTADVVDWLNGRAPVGVMYAVDGNGRMKVTFTAAYKGEPLPVPPRAVLEAKDLHPTEDEVIDWLMSHLEDGAPPIELGEVCGMGTPTRSQAARVGGIMRACGFKRVQSWKAATYGKRLWYFAPDVQGTTQR
jgi:hypothetical protein